MPDGGGSAAATTPLLLQWQYLIYLVPLGVAALLIALSTLRMGGGGGHGAGHAHVGGHAGGGHIGGGHVHAGAHHGGPANAAGHPHAHHAGSGSARRNGSRNGAAALNGHGLMGLVTLVTGWGKAPLPLVAGIFCLTWGVVGCGVNRALAPSGTPGPGAMLLSLLVALGAGLVVSRVAAEAFARLAPTESSAAVSRDGLFGLTGKVTFPADEAGGRIRVYDEFGTLHDEPCRVAVGHAPLPKGTQVMVTDRDAEGRLVVERV